MKNEIIIDEIGFKKIKYMPSKLELKEYYQKKYYTQGKNYLENYSNEEKIYIRNKVNQKFLLVEQHLDEDKCSFLELGSGEGWVLNKFFEKGYNVLGIDYSDLGCKNHNPDMLQFMIKGDLEEEIMKLKKKADVIWIENVLEHVVDPKKLISNIKLILNPGGYIAVTVPNDFSIVQKDLFNKGKISNKFWISPPDHLSYFDKKSLIKLFKFFGFSLIDIISDYPIDLNLYNDLTNYVKDKSLGKKVHQSRIEIENLFSSISDEKTNSLYRCFAELEVGREYFAIFKLC